MKMHQIKGSAITDYSLLLLTVSRIHHLSTQTIYVLTRILMTTDYLCSGYQTAIVIPCGIFIVLCSILPKFPWFPGYQAAMYYMVFIVLGSKLPKFPWFPSCQSADLDVLDVIVFFIVLCSISYQSSFGSQVTWQQPS